MKVALIFLFSIPLLACQSDPPVVANTAKPINVASQSNQVQTMIAHGEANPTPRPANSNGGAKMASGGDPIDTSAFDQKIKDAEKAYKEDSDDESKKALAEAFFERGVALTEARQYASALGDYRRAVKLDPKHEEAKQWIDQIVTIYKSLKKDAPKEGSEPPPLPFKKEA